MARKMELSDASLKIRNISCKYANRGYEFHLTSDLNWLRYIKQVELLEEIIPPRSRVLDIGCGLGHTTALLASSCEDISIIGADIQKHHSWRELKDFGCEFCACDASSLPFISRSFDVIVSFGVMEHTNSDTRFLKEINRCLKSKGCNILFQLPNRYSLSEYFGRSLGLWHHERTYTEKDIYHLIEICGFELKKISKEHFIPAQVSRISSDLGKIFDKYHYTIYVVDKILSNTRLSFFSQDYMIILKKSDN
jgi:ubiquinone/menaquinone biosynthesis C-methylase UbiE